MQNTKPHRSMLQWITLMVIVLISFQASAQSESRQQASAESMNPVQLYLSKNPEGILIKFYKLSPEDKDVLRAIDIANTLGDLSQIEKLKPEELKMLEQESLKLNDLFKQIDVLVRQGNSYDRAKIHVLNNQENAKINQGSTPAFMAAPSK
jgi:hypothetical protein